MGIRNKGLSCLLKSARASGKYHALFLLGLLSLLPKIVMAQCQGTCPPPPAPSTPTVPASPDTDGNYTVTTSYSLGSYGYTLWSTGQETNTSGSLPLSNQVTGSYTYRAKACYNPGGYLQLLVSLQLGDLCVEDSRQSHHRCHGFGVRLVKCQLGARQHELSDSDAHQIVRSTSLDQRRQHMDKSR